MTAGFPGATQPTDLLEHGRVKYGAGDILRSSTGFDWSGIAAELRHHPEGELQPPDLVQTELCIATDCHADAVVDRIGNGIRQNTQVRPGTIWTCPSGVREDAIRIREWHETLHIYLPSSRFVEVSDIRGGAAVRADHIRYLADLQDALILQIGRVLLAELRAPTFAGRVLAETLALPLVARLVQSYADRSSGSVEALSMRHGLDDARLNRVLDYMAAHIEDDISIDDMAAVACVSPFHFIRMFSKRVGMPPGRYLSRMRLEHAKTLLTAGNASLSEIALRSGFSSQANFARAFGRATGMTPGTFRGRFS